MPCTAPQTFGSRFDALADLDDADQALVDDAGRAAGLADQGVASGAGHGNPLFGVGARRATVAPSPRVSMLAN